MKMVRKMALACAAVFAVGRSLAMLYGDTPDAKHAWAVHDGNRPNPPKVAPAAKCGGAPSDAVVLFDGTAESFARNWCDEKGNPSLWKTSPEGYFYCVPGWKNGGAVYTRAKFGDCQLHLEYRHDPENIITDKGAQMRGNSGVFLMGNYEIQVLESYYTSSEFAGKKEFVSNYADGQAGAVYAENPPMVNPARKPGEWQVYDIVFHQPVWEGLRLVRPGSVTVFFNGVLVQDHWELEGLTTHCVRRPLAPHEKEGPLFLQDHGCTVQFRNIWYRPLPSRWDNKTHSVLSADENAVMSLRRETAAKLYAKIKDPKEKKPETLAALCEVIAYANESPYSDDFKTLLAWWKAQKQKDAGWEKWVNGQLDVLRRCRVIEADGK